MRRGGRSLSLAVLVLAPGLVLGAWGSVEGVAAAESTDGPFGILVGFHDDTDLDQVDPWWLAHGGALVVRHDAGPFLALRFPTSADAEAATAAALDVPQVLYVEPHGTIPFLFTPNDPLYPQQWGLGEIGAPFAWDVTRAGHHVRVAVLDTGIDGGHPDLLRNVCAVSSHVPGDPSTDDVIGHGTHVAGVIGADTHNREGIAGIADACLLVAKVGNQGVDVAAAAMAIDWAVLNGAQVISMSWGGPSVFLTIDAALARAAARHIVLVAAAGNSGCPLPPESDLVGPRPQGTVAWPARDPRVIAVANLERPAAVGQYYPSDLPFPERVTPSTRASSSCGDAVEVTAPGTAIMSTLPGGAYGPMTGTSMAAPHVSCVAALVRSANPALTAEGVRCVLRLTAQDRWIPGHDFRTGWGTVDAHAAVQLAMGLQRFGMTPHVNDPANCPRLDPHPITPP